MATLAGWMVASIVHLNPEGFEPLGLNPVVNCLLRFVFAFIGVWGFLHHVQLAAAHVPCRRHHWRHY